MYLKSKKYLNKKGYKVQILSNVSIFKCNSTQAQCNYAADKLYEEAERQVKERGAIYYDIEPYVEPNYGIMGVNLRVFNTKEIYDNYIKKNNLN